VSNLGKQFEEPEEVYKVPARFYNDHVDRHDDPHDMLSRIVKSSGSYHHVRLTEALKSNLHSDASYYADSSPEYVGKGLVSSAKATVKALEG
jgi:hypothetical protein